MRLNFSGAAQEKQTCVSLGFEARTHAPGKAWQSVHVTPTIDAGADEMAMIPIIAGWIGNVRSKQIVEQLAHFMAPRIAGRTWL